MKLISSKNFISVIVVLGAVGNGSAQFSILSLIESGIDLLLGGLPGVLNNVPTGEQLFSASIQTLIGLPEQAVSKVFNELCSYYVASDKFRPRVTPEIDELYFQLRTPCRNISVPLQQADQLLGIPEFDANKKVVLFITGWMSTLEDDIIQNMADAYNCRGDTNFLVLNASDFVQTLYSWSSFNTEQVGAFVAEGLVRLTRQIPVENIHLIGHSLGAHMVGKAGREFTRLTGNTLPRITGLDPASPCFNEGEILTGLYRGDAAFVDVIHSNPGVLGKKNPVGDLDFYPGGLGPIKPGCINFGCSHSRSIEYYTESVVPGNEGNFLAKRCNSLASLDTDRCIGPYYPMGFAAPSNLKGNYFLHVNARSPFGKNATSGAAVDPSRCSRCQN